ncbi:MAG: glycosyltransferase, partial [Dokdonella sp.]
ALAKLAHAGVAFRCRIIGEGPQRSELEQSIAMLDLRDRVELLGALPQVEVRALLHRASAFVLPSTVAADGNRDGIPVALMEAMAVGTPVISTRVSGIPELVTDGVSGLLVDGGDAEGLSRAVQRILEDSPLRDRVALEARRVVERDFDAATEASKLLAAMAESIAAGVVR